MRNMKNKCELEVYEVDGKDIPHGERPDFTIESHWNVHALVVITVGKHRYALTGEEIEKAVRNCTNVQII